METLIQLALVFAILAAFVAPAMMARKRYFAQKPRAAGGIVVGAAALAIVVSVLLVHARTRSQYERQFDSVFDRMCATPVAGDDTAKAFHELACSNDVRTADLRGASEYQGAWAHLATRGDKLVIMAPRSDLLPPLPAGKGFHLWLLDRAGSVVEHAALDRTMYKLLLGRPKLTEAVKAVVTIEGAAPAVKPMGQLVVQGELAPI